MRTPIGFPGLGDGVAAGESTLVTGRGSIVWFARPTSFNTRPKADMFRRSLARFGFSLVVVACFLAWQGYRLHQQEGTSSRVIWHAVGAAACAAAGLAGLRERHRPPVE